MLGVVGGLVFQIVMKIFCGDGQFGWIVVDYVVDGWIMVFVEGGDGEKFVEGVVGYGCYCWIESVDVGVVGVMLYCILLQLLFGMVVFCLFSGEFGLLCGWFWCGELGCDVLV